MESPVTEIDTLDRPLAHRIGVGLSGLMTLLLTYDAYGKLSRSPMEVANIGQLGFTADDLPVIGGLLLACVALYAIPRTALIGAVLVTTYLGGAFCATLRIHAPIPLLLLPVLFAVPVWLGLYLRSPGLRRLVRTGR
jgi:hypothetical protein